VFSVLIDLQTNVGVRYLTNSVTVRGGGGRELRFRHQLGSSECSCCHHLYTSEIVRRNVGYFRSPEWLRMKITITGRYELEQKIHNIRERNKYKECGLSKVTVKAGFPFNVTHAINYARKLHNKRNWRNGCSNIYSQPLRYSVVCFCNLMPRTKRILIVCYE